MEQKFIISNDPRLDTTPTDFMKEVWDYLANGWQPNPWLHPKGRPWTMVFGGESYQVLNIIRIENGDDSTNPLWVEMHCTTIGLASRNISLELPEVLPKEVLLETVSVKHNPEDQAEWGLKGFHVEKVNAKDVIMARRGQFRTLASAVDEALTRDFNVDAKVAILEAIEIAEAHFGDEVVGHEDVLDVLREFIKTHSLPGEVEEESEVVDTGAESTPHISQELLYSEGRLLFNPSDWAGLVSSDHEMICSVCGEPAISAINNTDHDVSTDDLEEFKKICFCAKHEPNVFYPVPKVCPNDGKELNHITGENNVGEKLDHLECSDGCGYRINSDGRNEVGVKTASEKIPAEESQDKE